MICSRGVVEPLIDCVSYSTLIALAGTCRAIRAWIVQSKKWQRILTDWQQPYERFPDFLLQMVDGHLVKLHLLKKNNVFVRHFVEKDAQKTCFCLMEVESTIVFNGVLPKHVFKTSLNTLY